MSKKREDFQKIFIECREDWRSWLQMNHERQDSVWVVTWKKVHLERHVPYAHLRDEALCFGWIDSLQRKLDQDRTMLMMSHRRQRSPWSAVNKARIEELIKNGLMADPGLSAISRAKQDGSWSLLDQVDATKPPDDLMAALRAGGSIETFLSFPLSSRRAIIEWITLAKRHETRERRISETARLATMGLRANHPESRDS